MSLWEKLQKPQLKLMPVDHSRRHWFIDLDECPGMTVRDLFNPHAWRHVRVRRAHDRSPYLSQLGEGDVVSVIGGGDGADSYDFDLICKAALPGALIMRLRGSDTRWDELAAAEASAAEARRTAVAAKAEAMIAGAP